ncbi:MAG: hypothetical protein OXN22_12415 [Deltaproteobacteria bacterium]|nr:hypothetical protein [Deltaproteobacteria bacterium]
MFKAMLMALAVFLGGVQVATASSWPGQEGPVGPVDMGAKPEVVVVVVVLARVPSSREDRILDPMPLYGFSWCKVVGLPENHCGH